MTAKVALSIDASDLPEVEELLQEAGILYETKE